MSAIPRIGRNDRDLALLHREKGIEMTSDETAASGGTATSAAGPPSFDTSVAHQARVYDYMLGGKL